MGRLNALPRLGGFWIWFTRVVEPMEQPGQTREALETVWPELQDKWVAWAERATDAEINAWWSVNRCCTAKWRARPGRLYCT